MVTLVVALVIGLVTFAVGRDWPGTRRLHAVWLRRGPAIGRYVRTAPATFVTLAVLGVTTWILAGTGNRLTTALLRDMSTNLHQLQSQPMTVLVRSAFWATPTEMIGWLVLFTLVAAPVEHWLGTRAWLVVFWAGHIGATLIVAVLLSIGVSSGRVPATVANTIDVGASYAFFCLAAVGTYGLRGRWRLGWAGVVLAYVVQGVFTAPGFTASGHALAAAIGFAIGPVFLRRPAATGWPVSGLEAVGVRFARAVRVVRGDRAVQGPRSRGLPRPPGLSAPGPTTASGPGPAVDPRPGAAVGSGSRPTVRPDARTVLDSEVSRPLRNAPVQVPAPRRAEG
ncbi:rhomboid-like protein [Raineyella sp. LH-20]|uniref:rhomboid-like protein n=1 Tax=Raineyella sp. LH-20 TaxID=3081204 RepID=UPI002954E1B0|nr:rhomboid-like protein [Raineyella sp. LH-20]WOP20034.1 rhomboid-like protein [Raineyella sp. LH-20]